MEFIEHAFRTLTDAFGPVGALFLMVSFYLQKRLFDIQDAQMAAAVADAKLQADLMNAFNNMKASFDQLAVMMRSPR